MAVSAARARSSSCGCTRSNCRWRRCAPAVHIQFPVYLAVLKEGKSFNDFEPIVQSANDMLNQLVWWTDALKTAREKAA